MDKIEADYERAINNALRAGKDDLAFELSIALKEYVKFFKEQEGE